MVQRKDPLVGEDILKKYLVGGTWKRRIIEKLGKGKSEKTRLGGFYIAIPPQGGWPGGLPELNGYRAGKGR